MLKSTSGVCGGNVVRELQSAFNLNGLKIVNADGPDEPLLDPSIMSGKVTAYFRDIEQNFMRHCHEADAVVGCVAWLTNVSMLRMLASKEAVSIVVQKEDFLRPDVNDWTSTPTNWKVSLRIKYNRLKPFSKINTPGVEHLSFASTDGMDAIRCCGNHNKNKKQTFPRMHNQFVVFCQEDKKKRVINPPYPDVVYYEPYAVWTGSFNFSENAARSFENVVVIEDKTIAGAYYEEWAQIMALSEPLDWHSEWCEPEWRIGT